MMRKLFKLITANMVGFGVGVGLLFWGIWQVYPPAALIATGLILMGISLFGEVKK